MWDMVDRGTVMVGCCLILVVIVAVTIPVVLISEDEPYVAPRGSDAPTLAPTPARMLDMVIYFISGPWTPVEGRLEWGSPVHECEWEGIFCKDVEDLEEELEGRIDELLVVGREDGIKIEFSQRVTQGTTPKARAHGRSARSEGDRRPERMSNGSCPFAPLFVSPRSVWSKRGAFHTAEGI